jgi:hypothetical protein
MSWWFVVLSEETVIITFQAQQMGLRAKSSCKSNEPSRKSYDAMAGRNDDDGIPTVGCTDDRGRVALGFPS